MRLVTGVAFVAIVAFALWHLRPSSQLLIQGSSYSLLTNFGHRRIRSLQLLHDICDRRRIYSWAIWDLRRIRLEGS